MEKYQIHLLFYYFSQIIFEASEWKFENTDRAQSIYFALITVKRIALNPASVFQMLESASTLALVPSQTWESDK